VKTRLSSGLTDWYRVGAPLCCLTGILMFKLLLPTFIQFGTVVTILGVAYAIWYGWRLSDVWLDGDMLRVKGLSAFQVPLSEVSLTNVQRRGQGPTIFFLGLDHPVGKVQTVRFIPAGDIEMELRTQIHAARTARALTAR